MKISVLLVLFVAAAMGFGAQAQDTLRDDGAAPADGHLVDFAELPNPSIGMGLAGIADYASQLPFIDLMKVARPWIGHLENQWGGFEYAQLEAEGYLDQNGWPTRLPAQVTGLTTLVLTDIAPGTRGAEGRFRLRYEGEGILEIFSDDRAVIAKGGEAWFSNVAGTGTVIITIKETDPYGTGDYLRNVTIVHEDHAAAFDDGEIFNPNWLARIRDMRTIRFMDWMLTNNSTQSDWGQRALPQDFTYGWRGVPLEVMIALAERIGADPWFTLPHLASDDYITRFAEYVHQALNPELKAYVELSNEVWNWQFEQARWADQMARARWGQDNSWIQYYALRASQMAQIWSDVYGVDADQRLVRVIATQTGWTGLEADILEAPLWTAEGGGPPHTYFDAYAVTGYFGINLGGDTAPLVLEWLDESLAQAQADAQQLPEQERLDHVARHRFDLAIRRAAEELQNGAISGVDDGSVDALVANLFPYHATIAETYGLDLIMYEGGTHVVGLGEWVDNDDLTAFFSTLNYSQEMGALYTQMLEGWKAEGGKTSALFVDVGIPSKWGSWGALRSLGDENPRWDAIVKFNDENQGWWETRSNDAFAPQRSAFFTPQRSALPPVPN